MALKRPLPRGEMAFSCMVMEHVPDDVGFVTKLCDAVEPGGAIAVFVPGRKDHWSFEDTTVGHLRRYDREDLSVPWKQAACGTSKSGLSPFPPSIFFSD